MGRQISEDGKAAKSMRKQRGNPPTVQPQQQAGAIVITETREYSLITPLAGGGAIAGKADEVTVIRATEIRGELRFWWRACYGGRYKSIDEMKHAEGQIWGQANKKDDVGPKFAETIQIVVEVVDRDKMREVPAFTKVPDRKKPGKILIRPDADIPEYAAFPLQPTETEDAKPIYKNVRFNLIISYPQQKQMQNKPECMIDVENDIQGTLWAWETFGGVGARTRRGFGALKLEGITSVERIERTEKRETREPDLPAPNPNAVKEWITEKFDTFGIGQKASDGVPSLSKDMVEEQIHTMGNFPDVRSAWKSLIDRLSAFRKDEQWPDRGEIKRLRDTKFPAHKQEYRLPKAAIGLPIVFHFPKLGKQADLTLQGAKEGHDRLASSLILRPLICRNNRVVGLAILLENYPIYPENLQVMEKIQGTVQPRPATIKTDQAADDVRMLKDENDVLKAFMNNQRGNIR
jgi:CRISPR-associated protein Cmr1